MVIQIRALLPIVKTKEDLKAQQFFIKNRYNRYKKDRKVLKLCHSSIF